MNSISEKTPSPLQGIWFGVIGFLFGAIVILYGFNQTDESIRFVETPGFVAWLFLISSVPALAIIFLFPIIRTLLRLNVDVRRNWQRLLLLFIGVSILIASPLYLAEGFNLLTLPIRPLHNHTTKILIITLIAYFVAFLAVVGIYVVHIRLSTLMQTEAHPDTRIAHFLQLRSDLLSFLKMLGILIGLSVLATGMLRNITLKQPGVEAGQFPPEVVVAFGGAYTLFVAIFYIPTFMTLRVVGQQLCDSIFPLPTPSDEQWATIYDKRMKLEALLQIQGSTAGNFTDNFIIAAPLIGSALSLLFK